MATITRFEDLDLWQKARVSCIDVFDHTTNGSFARDFALRDQINRSAGSIMDNIAEGFEQGSRNEFVNFLSYSKASAAETRSQIYRAFDRRHLSDKDFEILKIKAEELGKMVGGFMKYLNSSPNKGAKFKDRISPNSKF